MEAMDVALAELQAHQADALFEGLQGSSSEGLEFRLAI